MARIGGSFNPVNASPIADMLIVRGEPWIRSGRSSAAESTGYVPEDESSAPPAGSRHAPISAGRHATARTALPPP